MGVIAPSPAHAGLAQIACTVAPTVDELTIAQRARRADRHQASKRRIVPMVRLPFFSECGLP